MKKKTLDELRREVERAEKELKAAERKENEQIGKAARKIYGEKMTAEEIIDKMKSNMEKEHIKTEERVADYTVPLGTEQG